MEKEDIIGDRFLIGKKIGRGAFGEVFDGEDLLEGGSVALKIVSYQLGTHANCWVCSLSS